MADNLRIGRNANKHALKEVPRTIRENWILFSNAMVVRVLRSPIMDEQTNESVPVRCRQHCAQYAREGDGDGVDSKEQINDPMQPTNVQRSNDAAQGQAPAGMQGAQDDAARNFYCRRRGEAAAGLCCPPKRQAGA